MLVDTPDCSSRWYLERKMSNKGIKKYVYWAWSMYLDTFLRIKSKGTQLSLRIHIYSGLLLNSPSQGVRGNPSAPGIILKDLIIRTKTFMTQT